jgi:hypothetical protein
MATGHADDPHRLPVGLSTMHIEHNSSNRIEKPLGTGVSAKQALNATSQWRRSTHEPKGTAQGNRGSATQGGDREIGLLPFQTSFRDRARSGRSSFKVRERIPLKPTSFGGRGAHSLSHKDWFMSLNRFAAAAIVVATASPAVATITPTTLFGDSYIVQEGSGASARSYSVLDVYIKGSSSADIISSVFGVTAYPSSVTMNQGDAFVQSNGGSNSAWLPTNDDGKAWDSYVTCGARVQGSDTTLAGGKAGFLNLQLDTNWSPGTGAAISGTAGGPGWYPGVGASTSTNPYARIGFYNGDTTAINIAKTAGLPYLAGNGITAGQSLNNHWMIGRFVIEVTGLDASAVKTMTLKFAIAGKQNGTTTFTGSTSAAGRFNSTLTFAVPAPGAAALAGLASLIGRRRR